MKIKKKYLILMVITLLVSVGTLTYAYFEGTILSDLVNGTTVSTGNIDVEISDNVVNADNVIPIYNGSVNYEDATFKKTFTVTNSGTLNTCTDLYLKVNTIDEALISTDFRYMVINDDTGTTIEGNFSTASSGNDLKLGSLYFFEGETTKKYTMYIWIEYQENKDQMSMLNKSMNAILFVKANDVKTKDVCDTRTNYKITYETYARTNCISDTVSKGGTATLCTPSINGEEFKGWYTDNSYTNQVTSLTNATDDIKLYAKWNCTFDGEMVQGAEYVNGEYTYRYKQKGDFSSSGLAWTNIVEDGWGVQLTDKTSTEPVTSKLCRYINNKPVTSMSYMFSGSEATTIDLSSFDTSKVTDMTGMFEGSHEITTLDLSSFDTSNVTSMFSMFSECAATTLDLSNFDTSNVTNMSGMFSESAATTIDLSNFNTSNVTDMSLMFAYSVATTLDLSSFNTKNVNDMSFMFDNSSATTIDLSGFDTSKVTDMERMFYLNFNLKTIYASDNFNTNAVTSSAGMFDNSTNLVGGAGTTYNRSYVDKTYARIDGGTSSPGYFTAK